MFRISKDTGLDIVADFQVCIDRLDLSAFGLGSLAEDKACMVQVGADISLSLPGEADAVILVGVSLGGITAADLVLGPPDAG